jgi:hypothetical protein
MPPVVKDAQDMEEIINLFDKATKVIHNSYEGQEFETTRS